MNVAVKTNNFIKRLKQGDDTAYEELYTKYASQMKFICNRYIKDEAIAEDIVQEGFVKLFQNIGKLKRNDAFEGWMKRIFVNLSISYYRKQSKIMNEEVNDIKEFESGHFDEITLNEKENIVINGKEKLSLKEVEKVDFSQDELLELISKIPEKFGIVFQLFVVDKYKHKEIAKLLSINVKTSKTRLLRARRMLKEEVVKLAAVKING